MRWRCHGRRRLSLLKAQACAINSFSSGVTFTTQQLLGRARARRGRRYSARIDTGPDMTMACATPAGIHTARRVGTTQVWPPVLTVMTPRDA